MSLRDTSCYTLTLKPSASDPNVVDLLEHPDGTAGAGQPKYARLLQNAEGEAYSAVIFDHLTGARLASCGYVTEETKTRRLQLHGPDELIDFHFSGMIGFEWTFQFQGNKFRWTREIYGKDYICSMDRKPDPRVEICLARSPEKNNPGRMQILHYNIDRFPTEITDLRGLETLLVTTYMCFIDTSEQRTASTSNLPAAVRPALTANVSASSSSSSSGPIASGAPPAPPKKVITPEDYEPEDPNEIIVGVDTDLDEHIARAVALLQDPNMLFIVVRTRRVAAAQRAIQVCQSITSLRRRESQPQLKQYVLEEQSGGPGPSPAVPRRPVDLGPQLALKEWTSPHNIAMYLSTIELPDLAAGEGGSGASAGGRASAGSKLTKVSSAAAHGPSGSTAANPPLPPARRPSPATNTSATLPPRKSPVQPPSQPPAAQPAAARSQRKETSFGKALAAISGRRA